MARVDKSTNRVVAHLDGVVDAVHGRAEILGARAEGILAQHRDTGQARIEVNRGRRTDSFVDLVDPAAVALEYGRPAGTSESGREYSAREPLHILARTIGSS